MCRMLIGESRHVTLGRIDYLTQTSASMDNSNIHSDQLMKLLQCFCLHSASQYNKINVVRYKWRSKSFSTVGKIHLESKKNMPLNFCLYLHQILTDFKNSFTGTLCGKFAVTQLLNIPPHLYCVATLPREI